MCWPSCSVITCRQSGVRGIRGTGQESQIGFAASLYLLPSWVIRGCGCGVTLLRLCGRGELQLQEPTFMATLGSSRTAYPVQPRPQHIVELQTTPPWPCFKVGAWCWPLHASQEQLHTGNLALKSSRVAPLPPHLALCQRVVCLFH